MENTGTNFKVNYHEVNHDYLEIIPVAIHIATVSEVSLKAVSL